ncbi:MAG TPA: hypothetical protein VM264_02470, partial [Acidimicrobiales bacterium]|nr:hypothetical protein [Acidimicrobiales bacterium]
MLARHVVVDGSNIATEGRSMPTLAQLEEAVKEYHNEFPDDIITVVVDATFGHRIPEDERPVFDEAVAHNEVVSPPAGAIGRGDAFLLRVAEKVHATVLSNDSFQEFHGEHAWLFDHGRLIGAKPVPGVGWIFTPRTPVRGPRSRESVRAARSGGRKPKEEQQQKKVQRAIAVALEEAVEPDSPSVRRRRRRRGGAPPAEPVNAPLAFIEFVAAHPLGSELEGEVETFSSHGAFVQASGARCYIPLSALGDPPPRAAKDVLRKGEVRTFVLQALDPPRRGIELALPGFARVSGEPTPETVEDEIKEGAAAAAAPAPRARSRSRRAAAPVEVPVEEAVEEPVKRAGRSRSRKAVPVPEPVPAAAEPEAVPPPAEPAPAPRKRAARTKVAAEPLAAEPVAPPAEPAPAPRKRAARPKAAAEPLTAEPVAPPAEAAPAPRKRATRLRGDGVAGADWGGGARGSGPGVAAAFVRAARLRGAGAALAGGATGSAVRGSAAAFGRAARLRGAGA